MTPLPSGPFSCVLADPPWRFKSNSVAKPGRNARRHYRTMSLEEIAALPVSEIVAQDCALFLWITGPFLAIGAHMPVMKAWGFKPSGIAFVWRKRRMGTGFTTRKSVEFVVLGKRGRSVRQAKDVLDFIDERAREHSRKPEEAYRRIERYCHGDRVELFARHARSGWVGWGDEYPGE